MSNQDQMAISNARLRNQHLASHQFRTAKDLLGWMGAIQAQDFEMAEWALGIRLVDATKAAIEMAMQDGDIIRTHLLRPTWHFVSAKDIYWMLELSAPGIKATLKSRHRELGLSETIIDASERVIEEALSQEGQLPREKLKEELERASIPTGEGRLSHILLRAEIDGIVCSGGVVDGRLNYTLLEARVPKPGRLDREEMLAKLAEIYFSSRGPATLRDFAWWSGLQAGSARHALDLVKSNYHSVTIASKTYWFADSPTADIPIDESVHLLPAFDEFIISYEDRSASLPLERFTRAVSSNGVFRPVIVVNGKVVGIWKRIRKRQQAIVEMKLFSLIEESSSIALEQLALRYGVFLGINVESRVNRSI
jgi:hypothetical protein